MDAMTEYYDHDPSVNLAVWMTFVCATLAALTKLMMKYFGKDCSAKRPQTDDTILVLALVSLHCSLDIKENHKLMLM